MTTTYLDLLPPEVKAGYVYNRVLRAIGDSTHDVDRFPDGIPAQGTVTFTPRNSVKQVTTDNTGVTVTREPVVCTIHQGNDNPEHAGLLVDEAGAVGGVWLVVGEWTASYKFEDRYSTVPDVSFVVTEEHTEENPADLALLAGLTPSPTIKFVVNEQVYTDTLKARNAALTFRNEAEAARDESVTARDEATDMVVNGIRGPQGEQGEQGPQGPMGTIELIGGDNPAITVDTSYGTRVFVGDTMIYGITEWEYMDINDVPGIPGGTSLGMRRRTDMVDFEFFANGPIEEGDYKLPDLHPGFGAHGMIEAWNDSSATPPRHGSFLFMDSGWVQLHVAAGSGGWGNLNAAGSLSAKFEIWPGDEYL